MLQAIQERIKALDFQDCKVRVSNVDSQASFESIVIQVIGETSNKGAEPKKFVQTFVLAQQPSGYFVLNDIWRYIDVDEEDDEAEEESASSAPAEEEAAAEEPVKEPAPVEEPAKEAEPVEAAAPAKKVAPVPAIAKISAPVLNGDEFRASQEAAAKAKTEAAPAADAAVPEPELAATEAAEEEAQPEKPQAPAPTPVAKPEAPAEPAAPPKPMTWASRAAAAAGPRPVVPLPKTATPPATNQGRAPAPASNPTAAATTAAAPAAAPAVSTEVPKESSEWKTAGADSKRQNRPQSVSGNAAEKESTTGYVKYVTDKVQEAELRAALAAHGELSYFDINRQKNCAFVEYKTLEGYQAALSSNPHVVNGENIVVEPRHQKAGGAAGGKFPSGRGNGAARGRGGFEGSRSGGQGNGRGNFSGQNRGRGGARARGGAQANNA